MCKVCWFSLRDWSVPVGLANDVRSEESVLRESERQSDRRLVMLAVVPQ